MNVLVACEFSGVVREAFTKAGHFALSCDLINSERPGPHYTGDIKDILYMGWDLMIAHPPCTYLCNSGVTWLYKDPDFSRLYKMEDGANFFRLLLDAPIPKKAIENPIMHKYAMNIVKRKYTQIIQPYMFGHLESKATCLWLSNLPSLTPTNDVKEIMRYLPKNQQQKLHYEPPGPERAKNRSRTFTGIAAAMAEQWG